MNASVEYFYNTCGAFLNNKMFFSSVKTFLPSATPAL
jgi:hypothetical protein